MAYRLLQVAAKKRTETMVLEVGVDTERNFTAKIPVELLELVVGSDVDVDSPLTDETSEQVSIVDLHLFEYYSLTYHARLCSAIF